MKKKFTKQVISALLSIGVLFSTVGTEELFLSAENN